MPFGSGATGGGVTVNAAASRADSAGLSGLNTLAGGSVVPITRFTRTDTYQAVSYTHLDVYKRQDQRLGTALDGIATRLAQTLAAFHIGLDLGLGQRFEGHHLSLIHI